MGEKQDLLKAAVQLFSKQRFDDTTIPEITEAVHVTETIIYYLFKNKDDLFTHILISTFGEYFAKLYRLGKQTVAHFENVENLIDLKFPFVDEFPVETYLIPISCPAMLRDSAHICTQQTEK